MKIRDLLEAKSTKAKAPKPRNFVAKNAVQSGAGAHKDKKKAAKQGDTKHKKKEYTIEAGYRRSSYGYNPERDAQDQWNAYQRGEQDFRNRERNAGVEHEDDPDFERNFRQQQMDRDRGPWYLKINGKILKTGGQPKVFDWKSGATKYGQAIVKNKPELAGKIFLTKKNQDDVGESATAGATSAGNVSVGAVYKNKAGKTPKNKDGTAKNALDIDANLLTGGSIKR